MVTLVTTNSNPDLDGISSALGYAHLLKVTGKGGVAGFEGECQLDAKFVLDKLAFSLPALPSSFDVIVLVNSNTFSSVPAIVKKNAHMVEEVIDHRVYQDIEFEFSSVQKVDIQQVGACATIITEYLAYASVLPSREIATLLYAAIYSNTLDLKAGVTTERDREAVAVLASWYPILRDLIDDMFLFRTKLSSDQVAFALKNDFKGYFKVNDKMLGIAQIEVLDGTALLATHKELIARTLKELKAQFELDYIFLTVPCITQEINYLYTIDTVSMNFLKRHLTDYLDTSPDELTDGFLLKTNKLLLRKEIVPLFEKLQL